MCKRLIAVVVVVLGVLALGTTTASAHVLPTSSVELTVGAGAVDATVSIPVSDLEAASVAADRPDAVRTYLLAHVRPTSDDGRAWTVAFVDMTVAQAGDARTTGLYQQVVAHLVLTPPAGAGDRSFDLGYDAVVHQVATHVVVVTVVSDWASGRVESPYEVGTIARDTVTGAVRPLHLDLGAGSSVRGFVSMVRLGVLHIAEGTDHQLFLLTLLLPIGLGARQAVRRIARITLAFTLGHSVTLALGALGVPVPVRLVEAGIALSIVVAAAHAVRPLFPGREALVAAGFGLVHGLAFSETLRSLDLSGTRLVLSLLGFNLGIELMQLAVVALVLPPLVVLARGRRYRVLRVVAATLTGVAALGWLAARLGWSNPVADLADRLGTLAIPLVVVLWGIAVVSHVRGRAGRRQSSRSTGWPVIDAIRSKSLSTCRRVRPATSAVAASNRSATDGARCCPRSASLS